MIEPRRTAQALAAVVSSWVQGPLHDVSAAGFIAGLRWLSPLVAATLLFRPAFAASDPARSPGVPDAVEPLVGSPAGELLGERIATCSTVCSSTIAIFKIPRRSPRA
jgi:hypothetical protein